MDAIDDTPAQRLQVTRVLEQFRWQAELDKQGYDQPRLNEINRILNLLTACGTGWLGSHLYSCLSCNRALLGLNHCDNRHCPCCGDDRRNEWREKMIDWSLDCSYFHVVFTLPHDLNPLLFCNPRELYTLLCRTAKDVLLRTCKRELDCVPGVAMTLHTWGQRMNLHVHCHVILSAGGLSSDGSHWIEIPSEHPALQSRALAAQFQPMFLRRLISSLKRDKLLWPSRDSLPVDPDALGLRSYDAIDEAAEAAPAEAAVEEVITEAETPVEEPKRIPTLRTLKVNELSLVSKLRSKSWIVDCKPTPPKYRGAEAVINYLANYVSGTAIHDERLISVIGQQVTIHIKDYKADDVKHVAFDGREIVRRFVMHIVPRGMMRIRYSGLFAAAGRDARLAVCRAYIGQALGDESLPDVPANAAEAQEEPEKVSKCLCRYCQGDMLLLGRLEGTETMSLISLKKNILFRLRTLLPTFQLATIAAIITQLQSGWMTARHMPHPVRDLFRRGRFTPLERSALEALLLPELRHEIAAALNPATSETRTSTSGIPPPQIPPVEAPQHAA